MRRSGLQHSWRSLIALRLWAWSCSWVFHPPQFSITLRFPKITCSSKLKAVLWLHAWLHQPRSHKFPSAEMLVTVMSRSVTWPKLLGRTFSNSSISRDFVCCLGTPSHKRSRLGCSPHARSYSQKTHKMEVSKGRFACILHCKGRGFLIVLVLAS